MLMEGFSTTEQSAQAFSEGAVQSVKKRRSLEEKVGRIKWTGVLLNRALDELQAMRRDLDERDRKVWGELKEIKVMLRLVLAGFKGSGLIRYSPSMLERIACEDAVDAAILDAVFRAGSVGVLPKKVAQDPDLFKYGLRHYQVSRRIQRMNKRLFDGSKGVGELLFEKRGHRWALTSFASEAWGE